MLWIGIVRNGENTAQQGDWVWELSMAQLMDLWLVVLVVNGEQLVQIHWWSTQVGQGTWLVLIKKILCEVAAGQISSASITSRSSWTDWTQGWCGRTRRGRGRKGSWGGSGRGGWGGGRAKWEMVKCVLLWKAKMGRWRKQSFHNLYAKNIARIAKLP